jgi:mRNA-degrading endonuclease RelE of RelBE toxin-antitoxin system
MRIIETPIFSKEIIKLLPDENYRILQQEQELVFRPEAGSIIKGSGGLRKIRWSEPGKGKRGGIRVIYYYDPPETIYMLFPYRKNVQENLTTTQLKVLKNLVKEWLL